MTEHNTKRCPLCFEEIHVQAIKCKHCGSMLNEAQQQASQSGAFQSGAFQSGATPFGHHRGSPAANTPLTGIHLVKQALGDRYEILEEIGRGGMATVYKAIQKSLKRPVALKVVHQNLLHDTEFVARFHREAQLCASLNHPNIVTVHDEGEVSGVHFMAMECLEGTDLHRLIRSRGRLTAEQTLQYLLPVAEALDYAHGKGYIHRDIKSANIFITGSGRVVLMDFGIAHAAAGTQLTRAGTVIGTPEYMSPEQAEGKKVDHRTDLYSLGVVMYECLAGRVPFKGDNAASIIYKLVHEQVDASSLMQSPASVQTFIKALLSKQASNRPVNARSVAEGIKLLQQGKQWRPSGVSSAEAASGSKYTGEQTLESQTVKLGDKPGRASSQGGATNQGSVSPPKEKKKVSAVVWFLALLGLVLAFVLVYQFNKQQLAREQKERVRIEEQPRTVEEWESRYGTKVVEVTNPATGRTWMDRNLGASRAATSIKDAEAYGDLYQWGRASDGHQRRNSRTTSKLSRSNTPGHRNFILTNSLPYDWRSPQNDDLWQGVNGVNNPCPPGYRLPTANEWETEYRSWSSNDAEGAFDSPLMLPVAGSRGGGGKGSLGGMGSHGSNWSSTLVRNGSRRLHFNSSAAGTQVGADRARGLAVRCIKDD